MMTKEEIMKWLEKLPAHAYVGIDEGGLCLETEGGPYLEVGGLSDSVPTRSNPAEEE